MIDLVALRGVLAALENPSEEYYKVPIPGTNLMARTCEADQVVDAFMEAFTPEACGELLSALEEADRIFARLVAPCPQCHTVGDNPNCTATVHTLPREAKDDISAMRDRLAGRA